MGNRLSLMYDVAFHSRGEYLAILDKLIIPAARDRGCGDEQDLDELKPYRR